MSFIRGTIVNLSKLCDRYIVSGPDILIAMGISKTLHHTTYSGDQSPRRYGTFQKAMLFHMSFQVSQSWSPLYVHSSYSGWILTASRIKNQELPQTSLLYQSWGGIETASSLLWSQPKRAHLTELARNHTGFAPKSEDLKLVDEVSNIQDIEKLTNLSLCLLWWISGYLR